MTAPSAGLRERLRSSALVVENLPESPGGATREIDAVEAARIAKDLHDAATLFDASQSVAALLKTFHPADSASDAWMLQELTKLAEGLEARLTEALSALAEREADAERYRWLKEHFTHEYCKGTNDYWCIGGESKTLSFDHNGLDESIDAARAASGKGGRDA